MTNRKRRSFVPAVTAAGSFGLTGRLSRVCEWHGVGGEPASVRSDGETATSGTGSRPDRSGESIDCVEDLDGRASMIDAGDLEAGGDR
ncbi:hypothetical protein [Natrinema amylolyticum]|uniref:hypothetical protein n=1 Tax=Natrinema amylolyticum TaxID=2878679 RepID=UPI001CFAB5E4|nr:hypothetical protein [Natrinema amylolyticum]